MGIYSKNASSLSKEIDVAVPSGTYYRVRGYHAASQSGTKESTSTLTVVSWSNNDHWKRKKEEKKKNIIQ